MCLPSMRALNIFLLMSHILNYVFTPKEKQMYFTRRAQPWNCWLCLFITMKVTKNILSRHINNIVATGGVWIILVWCHMLAHSNMWFHQIALFHQLHSCFSLPTSLSYFLFFYFGANVSVSDKAILVEVCHCGAACVDRAIGSSSSAQSMCLNSRVRVNQDYDVLSIKQCS